MKKRFAAFASTVRRIVRIYIGWRRLHPFGFCPACNSDAPEKYDCRVCCNWNEGRPPKGLRKLWWKRFMDANTEVSGGRSTSAELAGSKDSISIRGDEKGL